MRTPYEIRPRPLATMLLGVFVALAAGGEGALADEDAAGAVCLECHEDQAADLAPGPHRIVAGEGMGKVTCLSCHEGMPGHWDDDPEAHPMSVPSDHEAGEVGKLCGRCHEPAHQVNQQTLSPHAAAGVTCLACHRVHGATAGRGSLAGAQPDLCYGCHAQQRAEFALPVHHPAEEGIMDCSDCHLQADDRWRSLTVRGNDEACLECHREFQGPFPHEHQAAVGYSTEEGGCLGCHAAHGSAFPRLLTQPYEGPHYQLCSQCHAVPGHRFNSFHGDEFAGVACGECHADIHGSYTSRLYFPPLIEAQGCLNAGCHQR